MNIDLNDKKHIPTAALRDENYNAWVERYQNTPCISPDGVKPSGGTGFINPSQFENNPADMTDYLNDRRRERDSAIGPDKERLSLLLNAEQTHAYRSGYSSEEGYPSAGEEREAMAKLMQYDHEHGHPIADSRRDLTKDPYTAKEQSDWHRRDGRQLTTQELSVSHALDWDSLATQRQSAPPKPEDDWHIHVAVKPDVESTKNSIAEAKQLEQELSQGASLSVGGLNADAIRARRGQSL